MKEFNIENYTMDVIEALAATEVIGNHASTERREAAGDGGVSGMHGSKERLKNLRDAFVARGHKVQKDEDSEFRIDEGNSLERVYEDFYGAKLNPFVGDKKVAAETVLMHSYNEHKDEKFKPFFPVW